MRFYFPGSACLSGGDERLVRRARGAAGGPGSLRSEFSFCGSSVEFSFSLAFSMKL